MLRNMAILALSARIVPVQEAAGFATTFEPEFCTFTIGHKTWDLSPLQINGSDGGLTNADGYYTVEAADYEYTGSNTKLYFNICGDMLSIPPNCNSTESNVCAQDRWGIDSGFCNKTVTRPAGTITHGVAVYDDGWCAAIAGIY